VTTTTACSGLIRVPAPRASQQPSPAAVVSCPLRGIERSWLLEPRPRSCREPGCLPLPHPLQARGTLWPERTRTACKPSAPGPQVERPRASVLIALSTAGSRFAELGLEIALDAFGGHRLALRQRADAFRCLDGRHGTMEQLDAEGPPGSRRLRTSLTVFGRGVKRPRALPFEKASSPATTRPSVSGLVAVEAQALRGRWLPRA